MISIERDLIGVVKGLPPKGYIYPEGVLLGCDDNIGATVTAFLRCCAIGYLQSFYAFRTVFDSTVFLFLQFGGKKWKVLYGLSCLHS